ncbi:MAG: glycosyltransferase family 2 protein [Kiritimatiellaeota bacterium]|nr:glycosyltransferase family 2 protein [Kiritimatiellota bacterium]
MHTEEIDLTVTAPVYNEEDTVEELVSRISAAVAPLGVHWELLLVLDGCTDGTRDRLLALRSRIAELRVIELSRNFGLQNAVQACLENSRGRAVLLLDGDLQDPPEMIPELYRLCRDGADVVYTRKKSRAVGPLKRLAFAGFYWVQGLLIPYAIPRQAGNFCCLSRRAVRILLSLPERNRYFPGLRAWIGLPSVCVDYDRDPRFAGAPKQNWFRLLSLAMDGIFYFTDLPLKVSLLLGVLSLVCAGGLTANVLIQKLVTHTAIPGWASTIIAISFFGGVQLVCLGILGLYVQRVFDEVRRRPWYVVDREWDSESPPGSRPSGQA